MGAVTRRSPYISGNRGEEQRRHRPDYWLLVLTILLLATGMVVVYAISPALAVEKDVSGSAYVVKQLIAIGIGAVLFGILSQLPLERLKQLYKPLLVAAAVLTFIAILMPVNPAYPAHRWIRFAGFSFQSVELLKFALLVWLAGFLAARAAAAEMADVRKTFKPIGIAFLIIAVVVAGPSAIHGQSDLGSLGVITAIIGAMCFVAGMPMRRILLGLLAILLVGTIAVVSTPYRRARLTSFMNPSSNCLTAGGYQQCQALIAVGSGGMVGLGLGNSVQAYGYLPEAGNDSIFAIYAEKFGLLGCAVFLGLFLALFTRIKRVAERAPDNFSRLLVIGIFAWLSTQVVVNIGAMVGLLPLKGITLPLISQGGSSVIIVLAVLGLVFQISRYTVHRLPETTSSNRGDTQHDNRRDGRRVRGAYNTSPGRRT